MRNSDKRGGLRFLKPMLAFGIAILLFMHMGITSHAEGPLRWEPSNSAVNVVALPAGGYEVTLTYTLLGGDNVTGELTGVAPSWIASGGGWTLVDSSGFGMVNQAFIPQLGYVIMGNIFGPPLDPPINIPHVVTLTLQFPEGFDFDSFYFNFTSRFEIDGTLDAIPPHMPGIGGQGGGVIIQAPLAEFTVTFDLAGGTGDFPPQTVLEGGLATRPATNPTREGFNFIGWNHNFEAPITGNTTITALWDPITPPGDPQPDRDALREAIRQAEARVQSRYTSGTWNPFAAALADARLVYADPEANQDAITRAKQALLNAKNELRVRPSDGNNNVVSPQTGDVTTVLPLIAGLFLAMSGVLGGSSLRRKFKK